MIRVLIIDDSVFIRTVVRDMLSKDPEITVVGTAVDGVEGLKKIEELRPDVVTLDIQMPKKDGLGVLQDLRSVSYRPKILMLSTMTAKGAEITLTSIRLGADDFMLKPRDIPHVREIGQDLISKVRHLVTLHEPVEKHGACAGDGGVDKVVLIGSSAGGPQMLDDVLSSLPPDLPAAVVVTQHMPVGFTAPLAERFNRICQLSVKETENGDLLANGNVLVSKAGHHTLITHHMLKDGGRTGKIVHSNAPPLHGVRPAVDKTFFSGAQVFGKNVVSVILSGMGNDAGEGAAAVKAAGGVSLICREEDCLVYGMARSAIQHNAVDQVIPLKNMAQEIVRAVSQMEGGNV
jgi:two-component system chemotaxis response regulator CheB